MHYTTLMYEHYPKCESKIMKSSITDMFYMAKSWVVCLFCYIYITSIMHYRQFSPLAFLLDHSSNTCTHYL